MYNPLWMPMRSLSYSAVASGVRLNTLCSVPGSRKVKKRVGRGRASGLGKTSGRGHKGQKARAGAGRKIPVGTNGGAHPFYQKFPKFGRDTKLCPNYRYLNLFKVKSYIERGTLDPSKPITIKDFYTSNIVGKIKEGVKLLARGMNDFDIPITIECTTASPRAIQAIEKAGGKVVFRYYNKLGLRALFKPHKFAVLPKFCRPPVKWLKQHYPDGDYVRQRNEVEHGGFPSEDDIEANVINKSVE